MQVVKNSILGTEQTLDRKTREAILALRLEEEFTKDQILERYLNTAYFGNGAYGVQAAAETYWGVGVGELDWSQAALLAALIRNPNGYNPIRFPDIAAERRALALDRLVDTGHLTRGGGGALRRSRRCRPRSSRSRHRPTTTSSRRSSSSCSTIPRFSLGETPEERYNAVFSGGLRIHTTFDPIMQQAALTARDDILPGDDPGEFSSTPDDGERRAGHRGGRHHRGRNRRGARPRRRPRLRRLPLQHRHPGLSRQAGLVVQDVRAGGGARVGHRPRRLHQRLGAVPHPQPRRHPDPYIAEQLRRVRVAAAATSPARRQRSSNCAFVRLGQVVGIHRVDRGRPPHGHHHAARRRCRRCRSAPRRSGPSRWPRPTPSIANDGIYNEPYYVDSITDAEGNVIYEHAADSRRAVSRQTARLLTEVLETNVRSGTGTRARNTLPARRRQDRHGPGPDRHLVRRLHAPVLHGRVDRRHRRPDRRCASTAARPPAAATRPGSGAST